MNILVISEHVRSDPFRSSFYNIDTTHKYYKKSIRRFIKGNNKFCYFINLFVTAFICRVKYKSWDIKLVISDNPRIGFLVSIINRLTLCNINHVIWNFNTQSIYTGIKLLIAKYACSSVSFIIVYSEHEKNIYSKMLNIPKSKIIKKLLSGPYLDDDRYIKLSNNSTKKDCIVSAGFSGRNYEYLSKIAGRMLDVRFVIIVYPDCLRDIKFTDNIEIVSGISELDYCHYITKAKLFFLPIKNMETANGHLGIVQAMSLRTMLITNITKGTKDYLQPDINCVIYPDGNIEETINIIRQSLRDSVRRQYIVEKAYNFARRNFNVQKDINTLNDIINLLLKKRDNRHSQYS